MPADLDPLQPTKKTLRAVVDGDLCFGHACNIPTIYKPNHAGRDLDPDHDRTILNMVLSAALLHKVIVLLK